MGATGHGRFDGITNLEEVAEGRRTLRRGDRGEAVEAIQLALGDLGFNVRPYKGARSWVGGADGDFGSQTDTAVRNFQEHAARLYGTGRADGVVGARTMAALAKAAPPPGRRLGDGFEAGLPTPVWRDGAVPLRAVIVTSEHRTFLFDGGVFRAAFPNATGQGGTPTDHGLKKVDAILGEADAAALGKRLWNNGKVFGPRIIALSWADGGRSGEEMHGTSRPDQLGRDVSHGCIRHHNDDILVLAAAIRPGDRVAVVRWVDDPALGAPSVG